MLPSSSTWSLFFTIYVLGGQRLAGGAGIPPQAEHVRESAYAGITSTPTVLTLFTPSPSAAVTPITSQGQLVTSYVPRLTLCPLPNSRLGPVPQKRQLAYGNHSIYANSTLPAASCNTIYSPTIKPICHATLTPLGSLPITIRDCSDQVTFRTDHGYTIDSTGSMQALTTKYIAPWVDVVTGVPDETITAEVCQSNGVCSTYFERWGTRSVEDIWTVTSTVTLSSVLTGPSIAILDPLQTLTITGSTPTAVEVSSTLEAVYTSESWIIVPFTFSSILPTQTPTSTSEWTSVHHTTIYQTVTSTRLITLSGPTSPTSATDMLSSARSSSPDFYQSGDGMPSPDTLSSITTSMPDSTIPTLPSWTARTSPPPPYDPYGIAGSQFQSTTIGDVPTAPDGSGYDSDGASSPDGSGANSSDARRRRR